MLFTKHNPPPRFYVYAYIRKSDSTPYYIGKGNGRRAWGIHHFNIPKNTTQIVILESNLTEIGALAIERRLIRWYGRKDLGTGILINQTNGGEGSAGYKAPLNERHKYSKPGNKNGMFGRKHADEVKRASSIRRALANSERKWYNNGSDSKFSKERPGPEWQLGRLQSNRWFNNGKIEVYCKIIPDSTWSCGRIKKDLKW
jgi:hypothetical protein